MEAERMAVVFIRTADILIEPNCQTVTGIWVSADPIGHLARVVSASELGAAVRSALSASCQGVPHPTDWREFPSGLLRIAGVRSWNTLQRSAARCQVEMGQTGLRVLPSRNGGTRGDSRGYHALEELAITLPIDATDETLGLAVLTAHTACR